MKTIFEDRGIEIQRGNCGKYKLKIGDNQYYKDGKTVRDANGNVIIVFQNKVDSWWDLRLFMGKTIRIGYFTFKDEKIEVRIKGIWNQKVYANEKKIYNSDRRRRATLGSDFDSENIGHVAMMFYLVALNDSLG